MCVFFSSHSLEYTQLKSAIHGRIQPQIPCSVFASWLKLGAEGPTHLSPNEVRCLVALEESTSTGCCAQRWTRRLTSHQQGAPICSHIVSHPVFGDKSQSTALSSTEAKWTHFSIMPESVTKARGSEWNMKSPLPPRQTDGQRHSLLFPALCLPSAFGISFRKLEVMT